MTDALKRRGAADLTACVAAELGALTLKIAYERWSDTTNGDEFSEVARHTLGELQEEVPHVHGSVAFNPFSRVEKDVRRVL